MLKKLSQFIDFDSSGKERRGTNNQFESKKFGNGFDFLHLINSWNEIAGNKLSEHTIPLKNTNGVLTILSNHSAFANEMKFMEIPLKKKIFQKFPQLENAIKSIHFIVDTTHFEKQKLLQNNATSNSKKEIEMPHPFSPEGKKWKKEAEELFKDLTDEDLKKSFSSLYIQNKFNSDK